MDLGSRSAGKTAKLESALANRRHDTQGEESCWSDGRGMRSTQEGVRFFRSLQPSSLPSTCIKEPNRVQMAKKGRNGVCTSVPTFIEANRG